VRLIGRPSTLDTWSDHLAHVAMAQAAVAVVWPQAPDNIVRAVELLEPLQLAALLQLATRQGLAGRGRAMDMLLAMGGLSAPPPRNLGVE
jgi:hypothetical protein